MADGIVERQQRLMRYIAVSFATLAVVFALAGAAFGAMARSLVEISPERTKAWESEWNDRARRLLVLAGALLSVAMVLFLLP